ncbi:hypothetical protein [Mesobacillus zeae]|uniref:hypothetical protein n=1 Tax=Mesobacillus zeae TaxID=1917180 RepID=UPI001FEC7B18|nr:hypothetical protein [Mesobacillus zeae]
MLGTSGEQELAYNGEMDELVFQFEDIYKEMNKLMDFYHYSFTEGKSEITEILLNGDHPMLERIHDEMVERFDIPVDTLTMKSTQPGADPLPKSLYIALGLGLKEA